MRRWRWIAVLGLALALMALGTAVAQTSCEDSGMTFTLDDDGVLTITGDGLTGTGTGGLGVVQSIPDEIDRDSVTSVVVGENIEALRGSDSGSAFASFTNLESAVLGEAVVTLGHNAFANCAELASVTLPSSLNTIENAAFSACPKLKSITLPAGMALLQSAAFDATLESATILSDDMQLLGTPFLGMLTHLYCNYDSLAGKYARDNAMSVTYLDAVEENGFIVINGVLIDYVGSATELVIPSSCANQSITEIGENVFCGGYLTSVTVPGSVKKIGKHAFENCSQLTVATLISGVEVIDEHAFGNCQNLQQIALPDTLTTIGGVRIQ